jgi:thymidylate kinase
MRPAEAEVLEVPEPMRRGRLYYFTGLDGSGKTTQAEALVARLGGSRAGWVYRWARWDPYVTSPLMALARRLLRRGKGEGSGRPTDDRGHAEFKQQKQKLFRSGAARRMWTWMVLLEYLPQAWLRLLPPLWRGRHIVCDRYLPDVWIDLAMNFGEGSDGVARLRAHPLCRLFPRPDRTLLFDVDPATGFARKQDGTPLAYLADREPLYRGLTELLDAVVVDANAPLEDVARQVREAMGMDRDA